MDWQLAVVGMVVLGAVLFLARKAYVTWSKPSCGDGCASCSQGKTKPSELIQLRLPAKKSSRGDDPPAQ